MTESFLPDIINKITQYKESRLLQPMFRAKKIKLPKKADWIKASFMQKLNFSALEKSQKFSPRIHPRKSKRNKAKCHTESKQADNHSELLVETYARKSDEDDNSRSNDLISFRKRLYSNDNYLQSFPDENRRWKQLKSIDSLNKKVRRYTSVCSQHNRSIMCLMEPIPNSKTPKFHPSRSDFAIQPWESVEVNDN